MYMKYEFSYREENGILYPELTLPEQTHYRIGKYGNLHLTFIKEHRRGTYTTLLTQFRLNEYLHKIDVQAHEMLRAIIHRLAAEQGANEALKADNALLWAQEMNACKAAAEEIVYKELIYV